MNEIVRRFVNIFDREIAEIPVVQRDIDENVMNIFNKLRKILVFYGLRRVGKTFILYQLYKKFSDLNPLYFSFSDESIEKKLEIFRAIEEFSDEEGRKLLLLDEIQEVEGWESFLRRLGDRRSFLVAVAGSSSVLSREKTPKVLRGRTLHFRVFPLSYIEFLRFKGKTHRTSLLEEYIDWGGMPELAFLQTKGEKMRIVREYFSTIVERDIIESQNIRRTESLRAVLQLVMNSPLVKVNAMERFLKSAGIETSKATISRHLKAIENAFFADFVELLGRSKKEELVNPKKVYIADNSFIQVYSPRFHSSRLLETTVYWELRRRFPEMEIRYWKSPQGYEVDFVLLHANKVKQLIQVAYSMEDEKTRKREERALVKASREFACKNLLILTWDEEQVVERDGKKIRYLPVWKWLLKK